MVCLLRAIFSKSRPPAFDGSKAVEPTGNTWSAPLDQGRLEANEGKRRSFGSAPPHQFEATNSAKIGSHTAIERRKTRSVRNRSVGVRGDLSMMASTSSRSGGASSIRCRRTNLFQARLVAGGVRLRFRMVLGDLGMACLTRLAWFHLNHECNEHRQVHRLTHSCYGILSINI